MRAHRRTTLLLQFAAATMLINTSCARRGVLVPDTDYGRENDKPADIYRIITTNNRIYIAREISTTDSTVAILDLDRKGNAQVFGGIRYDEISLPLVIDREDVRSLERIERSASAAVGGVFAATFVTFMILLVLFERSGGIQFN